MYKTPSRIVAHLLHKVDSLNFGMSVRDVCSYHLHNKVGKKKEEEERSNIKELWSANGSTVTFDGILYGHSL